MRKKEMQDASAAIFITADITGNMTSLEPETTKQKRKTRASAKSSEDSEPKKKKKEKKEKNIQVLSKQFIDNPTEHNFGLLCERINWGLRSHIYKIVQDDDATTEVLTKTFENIYYKRDQFNPEVAKFSTWMYRIAFNNALKYLQERKANQKHLNIDFEDLYDSTLCAEPDSTNGNIESYTTENCNITYENGQYVTYDKEKVISEFYDASVKCINELPDNLRVVMYDRLVNNKKIDDIAYDNQIPVSSVKNWLRKGKSELQELIKNKHSDLYDMYLEFGVGA